MLYFMQFQILLTYTIISYFDIRVYGEQFVEGDLSFNSPQEAYSEAFDYILTNLI